MSTDQNNLSKIYHNNEDEELVLKYMLSPGNNLHNVFKNLSTSNFFYSDNKYLFNIIKWHYDSRLIITYENIINYIKTKSDTHSDLIGGLNKIRLKEVTVNDIYAVMQRIQHASLITSFRIDFLSVLNNENITNNSEIFTNLRAVNEKFEKAVKSNIATPYKIHTAHNVLSRLRETILSKSGDKSNLSSFGMSTGYPVLDEYIGGFAKGNLVILGGDLNHGKTIMVQNIINKMVKLGKKVLIISLEMREDSLWNRFASMDLDMPTRNFTKPATYPVELKDGFNLYVESYRNIYLSIVHNRSLTLRDIEIIVLEQKRLHDIDVVVIDHIGLIINPNTKQQPHEFISDTLRSLRNLSESDKADVCIVGLCQLNRTPKEKGIPTVNNLMGSHTIGQHADIVLLIYIPEEEENNNDDFLRNKKNTFNQRQTVYKQRIGFIDLIIAKEREDTHKNKIIHYQFVGSTSKLNETSILNEGYEND